MVRFGFGYDIHRFEAVETLVLGGVNIPSELGLVGHSDADVLLHAICDALLGAAALGDIGEHFPDSDDRFKGASSLTFLSSVRDLLTEISLEIVNVDSTIVLQRPRVSKFIPQMRQNIARTLEVDISQVSVKATTNEGLGSLGRGEGCAAYAVASLRPIGST